MNAIYFLGCRQRYDARIGKDDEFVAGGAAAVLKYLEKTVDVSRPVAEYLDDVRAAAQAVQTEAQERTITDGALW